jgi:tetratricopeptide (TPR) repeat protein
VLRDNPENTEAIMQMCEFYLHKNDLDAAERAVQKAILISPEDEKYWSRTLDHIAYVRNNPESNDFLEPFTGFYRFEDSEIDITFSIHRSALLTKSMNQYAFFRYPVSDSQLITYNGFHTNTFKSNDQGKLIKLIHEQRNHPDEFFIGWKEDSLIFQAKNLLNNGKNTDALHAFRKAHNQNPEYYYLGNYIQHLEFVLSPEYETLNSFFNDYAGEYGDLLLYKEGNLFYQIDKRGLIYQLLPMAKDKIMIPSIYNTQIHIIHEGEEVTGLKYVLRDGSETFHPRSSVKALAR